MNQQPSIFIMYRISTLLFLKRQVVNQMWVTWSRSFHVWSSPKVKHSLFDQGFYHGQLSSNNTCGVIHYKYWKLSSPSMKALCVTGLLVWSQAMSFIQINYGSNIWEPLTQMNKPFFCPKYSQILFWFQQHVEHTASIFNKRTVRFARFNHH